MHELKNSDMEELGRYVFDDELKTGEGHKALPWIWGVHGYFSAPDATAANNEGAYDLAPYSHCLL